MSIQETGATVAMHSVVSEAAKAGLIPQGNLGASATMRFINETSRRRFYRSMAVLTKVSSVSSSLDSLIRACEESDADNELTFEIVKRVRGKISGGAKLGAILIETLTGQMAEELALMFVLDEIDISDDRGSELVSSIFAAAADITGGRA